MNKLIIIVLFILLCVLLAFGAGLLFVFSPSGNTFLEPYLKEKLEKDLGMHVDIQTFKLKSGLAQFHILVNKQADVRMRMYYTLWDGAIKGIYQIDAKHFNYYAIEIKDIDIEGNFSGFSQALFVEGKGQISKRKVDYHMRVIEDMPQDMIIKIKDTFLLDMYAKGILDTQIKLNDINPLEGSFSMKSIGAKTNPEAMYALLGKKLKLRVELEAKGSIKKDKISMEAKVDTDMATIHLKDTQVNIKTQSLTSKYTLDIADLTKLYSLIDTKLYGVMQAKGTIKKDKTLKLTGFSQSFGGQISYVFAGQEMRSKMTKVPLINILELLGYKKSFLGQASGTAIYNLDSQRGFIDIDIASFQIKPSTLTRTLAMVLGKDPSRIIFSNTTFHAKIKKEWAEYTLDAKGTRSGIKIKKGRFNKISHAHTAKFHFIYEDYHIQGKITGTIENPKVTLDPSSLLNATQKNKLKNKLEKILGTKAVDFLKGLSF
ncbi:MAG: hypothetical protein DRQ78_06700 [Epsilonproteobacteria bacterium]|nr:MAG: hypothetical protein DRQ78_06700 [Campylobacterota bacterium]